MSKKFIIRDPFGLHREGVIKAKGYAMWRDNILATRHVSDSLKTSYGPKGMKKLVTDKFGETALTNHGFIILDKMDFHHPVGKLLREAAKTVDTSVGDGTKAAIILVGEMLYRTDKLVAQNMRVGNVLQGYLNAYRTAMKSLQELSRPVDVLNVETLKRIIHRLFAARGLEDCEYLSELASRAILSALKKSGDRMVVDREGLRVVKKLGGVLRDSQLVDGVVLDKQIAHPAMPRKLENAKIALLNIALKLDEFRYLQPYKYQINITHPTLVNQLLDEENKIIQRLVDKILSTGANVVITRKKMDPAAKQLLARAGAIGISRLLEEEVFTYTAKVTGARVVSSVEELGAQDLGHAESVAEEKIGGNPIVVIRGVKNAGGATLLLRGSSERVIDEVEHAFNDAVRYVSALLEEPAVVPGGGAVEMALATAVEREAFRHHGVEQEAMLMFADCLRAFPKILAENAGHDPLDVLSQLKALHADGRRQHGFDVFSGKIGDMFDAGIVESTRLKKQVLTTAFETASMLLRIDEIVDRRTAKRHEGEPGGQ
ncbi:MAG: thermosome subunit beta [Candidatus Caldarchaeum sp.]|nr:thermosome subunit beta [Candidatus Caldarchaeum sp.]